MKKLAILMGGEFRNFIHCYKTWDKELTGKIEFDLYLSTWDSSYNYSERLMNELNPVTVNKKFYVNESLVRTVVGSRLKFLNIEKEINFEHRGNKQLYHWFRLISHLINFKNDYDYVFITRPDVEKFNPNLDFVEHLTKIDTNFLYGHSEIRVTEKNYFYLLTVHDIYFLGTPEVIINNLLYLNYMETKSLEETLNGKGTNIHNHLAEYFVKKNIHILSFLPGSICDSSSIIRSKLKK